MGRSLRIEGAGLWYHVMCRGNGGRYIFDDEKDYLAFLARLATVAAGYHVEVHAYVLMGTHVHLFLRTREANLSRYMQRLLTGYTNWHNGSRSHWEGGARADGGTRQDAAATSSGDQHWMCHHSYGFARQVCGPLLQGFDRGGLWHGVVNSCSEHVHKT